MTRNEQSQVEVDSRITVGELIDRLSSYPKDTEITFGCLMDTTFLTFYRLKQQSDDLLQIELNELRD